MHLNESTRLSAHVNNGAPRRVGHGAAEHFVGYWCGIAFTQEQEAKQIENRIASSLVLASVLR
jgi:hypothetical protein